MPRKGCGLSSKSDRPTSSKPAEQFEQLVALRGTTEAIREVLLHGIVHGTPANDERRSSGGQVKGVGALIAGRWTALDKAAFLKAVSQRHEVGALDSQRLGDLGLLAPRIVGDEDQ